MNLASDMASSELLYVGFNQDYGCLACGTTNGFNICNVDPFRETYRRLFSNGGIGIVEMLFRCNLLAIVGGGRNPRFPTNKVMIWDDLQNRCIGELMFKSEVHAVKLRRDRIVVVLLTKVYVYRFKDLVILDQKQTIANPKGLISLCADPSNNIMAIPGLQKGWIHIELYNISKATLIKAHDSDLAQFALTSDGSKIASASDKGTLIRLWDTNTGDILKELRRGMDRAEIYSIAFSPTASFVACSSDKGTVHIFSLTGAVPSSAAAAAPASAAGSAATETTGNTASNPSTTQRAQSTVSNTTSMTDDSSSGAANKSMSLGLLRSVIPARLVPKYFDSEWSYAQVHGIEGKSVCAFNRDTSKIFVVSSEGTFTACTFLEGGECSRISVAKILQTASRDADDEEVGLSPMDSNIAPTNIAEINPVDT